MTFGQHGYAYRFDWGMDGLGALARDATVVVVVDVLRFSSAVSAAIEAGSTVTPRPLGEDGASLSPTEMLTLPAGSRLTLPSPNGGALSAAALDCGAQHVLAGCLRNATATARRAAALAGRDGTVAVIAAGERWGDAHGMLRPAVEDLLGAGAVLAALDPSAAVAHPRCSPEALSARAAFLHARARLHETLSECSSGRELIGRGSADDVAASAALDVTELAAELIHGEFRPA